MDTASSVNDAPPSTEMWALPFWLAATTTEPVGVMSIARNELLPTTLPTAVPNVTPPSMERRTGPLSSTVMIRLPSVDMATDSYGMFSVGLNSVSARDQFTPPLFEM